MDRRLYARAGIRHVAVVAGNTSICSFRRYHRRMLLACALTGQVAMALIGGVILSITGLASWDHPAFWLITGIIFIIGSLFSVVLIIIASRPLDNILTALIHKRGERTTTPLPNPNAEQHAKTGFKTVLELIYSEPTQPAPPPNPDALLTQALNHTSCGIVVLDPTKRIISANKAAPIATDADGQPYLALDFLNEQSLETWLSDADARQLSAERTWRRVATTNGAFKKTRFFDIIASYQKDAPGETVIILIDRSAQYLLEEEDLNFISFAAHELRGPITIIRGYLDVLAEELAGRLKGDEPQLLARLTVSANRLSGYINNILNVAKFDRHHLSIHLAEDSLADIYGSIADDMQLRASTQHRLLNISIPSDLPTVAADRSSISEVISNLIDNAIKYSFEGGTVSVSAEQKGDFIEVSVTDNGVGMPPSVVRNLFHKFYRSHRSRETVSGTGIGLYICKAFIESHGGHITARSKENEGSAFSFTVPVYAAVKDKLLEDGQLNCNLIRQGGGWIKNHAMYRG